jgi:transcriptional antiterminator NusG
MTENVEQTGSVPMPALPAATESAPQEPPAAEPAPAAPAPVVEPDEPVSADVVAVPVSPPEPAMEQPAPESAPEPAPEPLASEAAAEAAPAESPEPEAAAAEESTPPTESEEAAPAEADAAGEAAEPAPPAAPASKKKWYVVKVQSGREETIREAIERRVKIEGLDDYFGRIIIPVERVTEMRGGKRVKKEHKLYPGYLMVEVEFNDRILYLFRETSGVGDFVGGTVSGNVNKPPPPMTPREVERMLEQHEQSQPGAATGDKMIEPSRVKHKFEKGDRLRVRDGAFSGMEGEVVDILEMIGKVKLQLTIFGRPVPVELEYWQVERV